MIEIRSYRGVFDIERRIYTVDRLRLNPGGIPVRAVVYGVAILLATVLAARLPLLGLVVTALPWYVRDIAAPAGLAALLNAIRVEGRPFHFTALALLRCAAGPAHLTAAGGCSPPGRRWSPSALVVLPDGSEGRLRRLRYVGPGVVFVSVAHERTAYRCGWRVPRAAAVRLTVRQLAARRRLRRRRVIVLQRRVRLDVLAAVSGVSGTRAGARG